MSQIAGIGSRQVGRPYNRITACSLCRLGVFADAGPAVWLTGPLLGIAHVDCAAAARLPGTPVAVDRVTDCPEQHGRRVD